jgi:hypothetical protein
MKLAWLCYNHQLEDEDDDEQEPVIRFTEPSRYRYARVVMIVYATVESD